MTNLTLKKDTLHIIGVSLTHAKDLFRDHVWKLRCQRFDLFEKEKGITAAMKTSHPPGLKPNLPIGTSALHITNSSRPPSPDRWKKWISLSLSTGRPWMGFLRHINSLF